MSSGAVVHKWLGANKVATRWALCAATGSRLCVVRQRLQLHALYLPMKHIKQEMPMMLRTFATG